MPKEDVDRLIAASQLNEQVENHLLLGLPVSASIEAELAFPNSDINLSREDIELLKSIKANDLLEYTEKLAKKAINF